MRQLIDHQLDRLTQGERGVLEAASVAGREFSAASVAAALDSDVLEVEAEVGFVRAIETAREQGAKLFELRAVMSLGRLRMRQGKKQEARMQLAEVYGWFTEGFDTKDLREARALLETLA